MPRTKKLAGLDKNWERIYSTSGGSIIAAVAEVGGQGFACIRSDLTCLVVGLQESDNQLYGGDVVDFNVKDLVQSGGSDIEDFAQIFDEAIYFGSFGYEAEFPDNAMLNMDWLEHFFGSDDLKEVMEYFADIYDPFFNFSAS